MGPPLRAEAGWKRSPLTRVELCAQSVVAVKERFRDRALDGRRPELMVRSFGTAGGVTVRYSAIRLLGAHVASLNLPIGLPHASTFGARIVFGFQVCIFRHGRDVRVTTGGGPFHNGRESPISSIRRTYT